MKSDTVGAVIVFAVGIAVVAALIIESNHEIAQRKQCESACGIIRPKIIDDACYCKNASGWERPIK